MKNLNEDLFLKWIYWVYQQDVNIDFFDLQDFYSHFENLNSFEVNYKNFKDFIKN
tara:strand:- start:40 stop:204 length:165 start_codon:yes stop_codon:yes gene_type:complete